MGPFFIVLFSIHTLVTPHHYYSCYTRLNLKSVLSACQFFSNQTSRVRAWIVTDVIASSSGIVASTSELNYLRGYFVCTFLICHSLLQLVENLHRLPQIAGLFPVIDLEHLTFLHPTTRRHPLTFSSG